MNEQQYLEGKKNFLIRVYFYLISGVNAVSEFRNVIIGIFGLYLTLKLNNPWVMVSMFAGAIVILIPTGHFMVHHVNKIKEWLGTKFGSHYQVQNFDYVKMQYELMLEIRDLLKKK